MRRNQVYALPAEAEVTLRARHPELLELLRPLCELRVIESRCRDPDNGDEHTVGRPPSDCNTGRPTAASCGLGVAAAKLQTALLRLREVQVSPANIEDKYNITWFCFCFYFDCNYCP